MCYCVIYDDFFVVCFLNAFFSCTAIKRIVHVRSCNIIITRRVLLFILFFSTGTIEIEYDATGF